MISFQYHLLNKKKLRKQVINWIWASYTFQKIFSFRSVKRKPKWPSSTVADMLGYRLSENLVTSVLHHPMLGMWKDKLKLILDSKLKVVFYHRHTRTLNIRLTFKSRKEQQSWLGKSGFWNQNPYIHRNICIIKQCKEEILIFLLILKIKIYYWDRINLIEHCFQSISPLIYLHTHNE